MFKANSKKWLTRLSAFTLAATVAITSINLAPTLTVHATENQGGQDSGGNTGGGDNTVNNFADLNFTGPPAWNITYQGYRFYVIDQNLERISDIYDYRYTTPSGVGEQLFNTRFDGANSPSTDASSGHVHRNDISDLIEACQQTVPDGKTIPYPIIKEGSWKGNGHNFKLWFMGEGDPYDVFQGNRGAGSGSGTNKGGSSSKNNNTLVDIERGETKDETEPKRDEKSIKYGKDVYNRKINYDALYSYYSDKNDEDGFKVGAGFYIEEDYAYYDEQLKKDAQAVARSYTTSYNNAIKLYANSYDGMTLEECKYAAIYKCSKSIPKAPSPEHDIAVLGLKILFDTLLIDELLDMYDKISSNRLTQDNLLTQSIPLTGDGAATIYPITYYGELKNEPNGFYMPNHVDKYPDLGTALDNGCALVVEPLTWINVRTNARNSTNRDWGAASSYKSTKTYGSYYNIVQEWKSTGGTYSSIIDYTLPNCMATSKDFITDTGYKVIAPDDYTSKKIPSVGKDLVNRGVGGGNERYGLSMHIYSNFGGSSSSTSTYDDPLGTTIAPAPDPSSLPPETSDYPTTSKQVTIIKNYVTREESIGTEVVDGNFIRQQNPHIIDIEDEPEYTVVQWETSTHLPPPSIQNGSTLETYDDLTVSSDSIQSGSSSENAVKLTDKEFILYVKLQRVISAPNNTPVTGDFVIHESEVTKPINLTDTSLQEVIYKLPLLKTCSKHCDGHTRACDSSCYDYYGTANQVKTCGKSNHNYTCGGCIECTFTDDSLTNRDLNFSRINSTLSAYTPSADINNRIIAISNSFKDNVYSTDSEEAENGAVDTRTTISETESKQHYVYDFVAYRGKDELTVTDYDTINHSNRQVETEELFKKDSLKSLKTRQTVNYTLPNIAITLSQGTGTTGLYNKALDLRTEARGSRGCVSSKDATTTSSDPNASIEIAVEVYSGLSTRPLNNKLDTTKYFQLTQKSATDKRTGRQVSSGASLKFYPYIWMTTRTLTEKDPATKAQTVNIMSEHERSLVPNDFAEVIWNYSTSNNLLVKSDMWATDVSLTSGNKGWNMKNQVLKGGAHYNLSTPSTQLVTLKTFQAVSDGYARDASTITSTNGFNLKTDEAVSEHEKFKTSSIKTLESLSVVQYVSQSTSATTAWESGIRVGAGASISSLGNGSSTTSTETKYYLRDDASGLNPSATEADLDVNDKGTTYKAYKFSSDPEGNIRVAKSSGSSASSVVNSVKNELGSVILTKSQAITNLSDTELKDIEERTLIISKLIDAVERNTGNDVTAPWAPDGKWYNEAYDGIIILVQETSLEVGLKLTPERTTVLDPKLIPRTDSKGDQFTTAFLSQYKTASKSVSASGKEANYIGTFKNTDVFMKQMDLLFYSNKFYITNGTVQEGR